ncbi:DUF6114 domain-containing protein [Nocardioides sp. Soil796]|nr:DUF6114 domain-containing protein [Nocardioides sp. Soil796]
MSVEAMKMTESTAKTSLSTRTWRGIGLARRWFRAFRRTRPFWGALWLALGGLVIIHFARSPITMVIGGGWNSSAGYILGGGMVMFALVALFAPLYRSLVGIVGVLLGLAAFIAANLGGFLIGTLLAIFGGSMIWAWGEKKPRKSRADRTRKREIAEVAETAEGTDDR